MDIIRFRAGILRLSKVLLIFFPGLSAVVRNKNGLLQNIRFCSSPLFFGAPGQYLILGISSSPHLTS